MTRAMIRSGFGLALLLAAAAVRGQAPADVVAADTLLAEVRARLPDQPFSVQGELLQAGLHQLPSRVCYFDADLDFTSDPVVASYVLRDRFGSVVSQLTVVRPSGEAPEFLFQGAAGEAPAPGLDTPVAGTDITWGDLSLSFLWWRGGVPVGQERILGRECHVLEYPLAARTAPAGTAVTARLWIDAKLLVLLQVEELDAAGARVRRVHVKDFKKIGDMWMIKNMEARSYQARSRTVIHVNDARALAGDAPAAAPGPAAQPARMELEP